MASRKVKVAVFGTIGKSIQLETGATFGATLGSNVFTPDGVVGTPNTVRTWLGLEVLPPAGVEEDPVGITQHRLLQGLTVGDDHPQYTRKDTLTTLGDIYVRGASAPQRLGVGSVSDVLAIVAGVPTWSQAITPTWTGKHTFSVAPQVVALELGDAADTTLSRVSAGIVAVEGINLTRENRQIISGGGLTGGGDLSADRTLVVGAGTGITVNADDVALANTAVTPGSYTNSSLTVDQQGRLTAASSGAATVPTTRTLTAGAGLTGGGDLSADRTFNVGAGTGITVNADDVALDTASTRNTDHSAVTLTAGAGLTGGGDISASRTFTVGAGTGITVNADDVALANTAVTPGSYTSADITVDAQGRLTAAANGSGGGGTVDTVVGGSGIDVDATDPANPIVSLDAASEASLDLADSAVQPARTLTAGAGLTGGGDLSADRTFNVGAGTGITVNADDVALANTAVTPASYTYSSITVDQQGRLTAASSGAAPQPLDATLTALAGLTIAQGNITYGTGADAFAQLAKDTNATRYLSNTGTSNNPAWAQVALATGVSGDLPFANLTQIAGLSVMGVTGSATADVAAITAATDGHVLKRVSSSSVAFADISANPTGTIGLAAVNGTAVTFLRSDGAPALSQAIAPTWTAAHTFTGSGVILLGTDSKELRFGTGGDDLAIYHDGATNFIDANNGSLYITASGGQRFGILASPATARLAGEAAGDACRYSIYTDNAFGTERMYLGFPTDGSDNVIMRNVAGDSIAFRVAGNASRLEIVTDGISIPSNVRFTGAISPAQIVANTDNYNPTNLATSSVLRLSTDASRNLTGIVAQAAGTRLLLCNIGAFNLVLVHDATSTAANRFLLPASANLTIIPNAAFEVWYDTASSRWRSVGGA